MSQRTGITLTLREYQERGLEEIRQAIRDGSRAVLYVLPTGGGKTVTYAAMAAGAAKKGNRILILEHRKELIRQASLAVGGLGVRHQIVAPPGKIADIRRAHIAKLGWPMVDNTAGVAVASVQTLARRMDWLEQYDPSIIIIDEAHHAVAGTWARIIEACPGALLVGVTATPCRTDGQGLGDVFSTMVLGPSMRDLVDEKYLLPARVFVPPQVADLTSVAHRGGDIDPAAAAELMNKPSVTGDAVEHYRQLAGGQPAIVFCSSVKHAQDVCAQFCAAGYCFEVVTGDMEGDDRDRAISGLADGRIQGICTVDVVSEGTDIPVAEVAILLRPTESESLCLQQVGRVLRPVYAPGHDLSCQHGRAAAIESSGKQHGLILDHVGNIPRHGMPISDRAWTLDGRKRGKRGPKDDEPTIKIMQCPKCYLAHEPADSCPGCGHQYEITARKILQVDGVLQEVVEAPPPPKIQTGKFKDAAALRAAGIPAGQAAHILAAREEKNRLRAELRDMLIRWSGVAGQPAGAWGFSFADIAGMKPKQLKENIEAVGAAMFTGVKHERI